MPKVVCHRLSRILVQHGNKSCPLRHIQGRVAVTSLYNIVDCNTFQLFRLCIPYTCGMASTTIKNVIYYEIYSERNRKFYQRVSVYISNICVSTISGNVENLFVELVACSLLNTFIINYFV